MPRKKIHKAADVCKLVDIQPYVLRYWETEFPFLRPESRQGGARGYNDEEIELVRRVRALLYEEGYTIAGAKKKLEEGTEAGVAASAPAAPVATVEPAVASDSGGSGGRGKALERAHERLRTGVEEALDKARTLLTRLQEG